MGVVVWSAGAGMSRSQKFREAFAAFVYHYQRVVMGPEFGR